MKRDSYLLQDLKRKRELVVMMRNTMLVNLKRGKVRKRRRKREVQRMEMERDKSE